MITDPKGIEKLQLFGLSPCIGPVLLYTSSVSLIVMTTSQHQTSQHPWHQKERKSRWYTTHQLYGSTDGQLTVRGQEITVQKDMTRWRHMMRRWGYSPSASHSTGSTEQVQRRSHARRGHNHKGGEKGAVVSVETERRDTIGWRTG